MPTNRTRSVTVEKTLKQLFTDYLSECEYSTMLRPATIIGYKAVFKHFSNMMPEITNTSDLTIEMMNEFFKRIRTRDRIVGRNTQVTGLRDSTVKTYASRLDTFFEWLVNRDLCQKNPLRKIKMPTPQYTDSRALKNKEVKKIYAAIVMHSPNPLALRRDMAMVSILFYCGVRLGEFISLQVTDIDMNKRQITVRGETSKSKKTRSIPIHPTLLLHIREYIEERNRCRKRTTNFIVSSQKDEGLSRHGLKHWVKRLNDLSGVKFHLHQFRHSFACNLAESDVGIVKIQSLMGHASFRMTATYLRSIQNEDLREDINKICI